MYMVHKPQHFSFKLSITLGLIIVLFNLKSKTIIEY